MKTINFNVNNMVKVKLTNRGREILKKNYEILYQLYPDSYKWKAYADPKIDEDGYTQFQLWDLMLSFGEFMHMGGQVPFETEIILEVEST